MAPLQLAWNTKKNKMKDIKGKENEQERKGKIRNEDIDLNRTHLNYDLVQSDKGLYQRVKERVDYAKANGSRVQVNSVVTYSNILTVPNEYAMEWGKDRTAKYFECCYDYFSQKFGRENVVSAKVHLDETAPHMHLHFVPFNPENGKLQARISMNKEQVNTIHDELPEFLRNHGFDVIRGKGKTKDHNIEDVHEYKEVMRKTQEMVDEVVTEYLDIKEKVEDVEADLLTLTRKSKKKQKEIESLDTDIEDKTNHAEILAAQNKEMQQRLLKMRRTEESRALRLKQLKELDDEINEQIEKSKQRQQQQRIEFEAQWQAEQKQHAEKMAKLQEDIAQKTTEMNDLDQSVQKKTQQLQEVELDLIQTIPDKRREMPYMRPEVVTEVEQKVFGKAVVTERKTGNYVIADTDAQKIRDELYAAATIKNHYEKLITTDLAKENSELRNQSLGVSRQNRKFKNENTQLITENKHLKEINAGLQTENKWLKSELDAVYKGVKSFVQENFRTVKEAMQRVTDHVKWQVSFTTTFEKKNQEDNKRQSKPQPKPKQNDFDLDL